MEANPGEPPVMFWLCLQIILLSKGKKGSCSYYKGLKVERPAYLDVKAIDTTGAGDTFFACAINYILENRANAASLHLDNT